VEEILFPGEPEYRMALKRSREGIPVEDSIWAEFRAAAHDLGVTINAGGRV
jgi:LDH2 family malate/lactate/ureidoglycolate dehydrogenase